MPGALAACRARGIGLVSFWQLERDHACPGRAGPITTAQDGCSGVAQNPYAFAHALAP